MCRKFDGDFSEIVDSFGRMVIFNKIILLIDGHRRSFHLLLPSWTSYSNILNFYSCMLFTFLVRVVPRYLILLEVIVKGISIISFSVVCNLYIGRVLILFVCLFCIQLKCWKCLSAVGFSCLYYQSSANKDTLISLFPILIPLISLNCLTSLAKTSHTILKQYGECGQHNFVPYTNRIALSFCLSWCRFIYLQ